MEILNVASDDRAAKTIANYLSSDSARQRDGLSSKNKIYEFETSVDGRQSKMKMTSVSENHLFNYMFRYNKWSDDQRKLLSLFDTPIERLTDTRYTEIKRTLEREVRNCQALIIWTYCDPIGENMGLEVVEICQAINSDIKIYRARFSTMTPQSIQRALDDLGQPNKAMSDSVNVRRQLDLRIGVAFTRFQRMRLVRNYPRLDLGNDANYGSCLLPTLGFVVERFLEVKSFQPKSFWTIKVTDVRDEVRVEFEWEKNHVFEEIQCQTILNKCRESSDVSVAKVTRDRKSKPRPLPLNTVELAKHCLELFNFTAKKTMDIALDLYNQGAISLPQTKTNQFPDDLDLTVLVKQHIASPEWGMFAQEILKDGPSPRQGTKNDGAHPPIYPRECTTAILTGDEAKVYGFIVRHFLACLSRDAEVEETIVYLTISEEKFVANGLRIIAKNYLAVYPYENCKDIVIHEYEEGQTFSPIVEMLAGKTSAPNLLTESDLMSLKEEHRIGTDSTYAEHIESIKLKNHVKLTDGKYLIPTKLGLAMVQGYDSMELGDKMSKPDLRRRIENDLELICTGMKLPAVVLRDHLAAHRAILAKIFKQTSFFDATVAKYLNQRNQLGK